MTERSGQKSWVPWRLQGPTCLRHTWGAWAAESLRHAFWAPISSQPPRDTGKAHQAAVRALAFPWLRSLSRGWQARTPYDASVSLPALQHRGASLIHKRATAS